MNATATVKHTHTRPEKDAACALVCYAMRQAMVEQVQAHELNHAEALNAAAQVFASILAGAYHGDKNREIVISMLPDVIRAYLPQWDDIYGKFRASAEGRAS